MACLHRSQYHSGAYLFHPDRQTLELLKQGNFRKQAGYLGLEQELPADAAVDIFFMADLRSGLHRFGNRGYRAAQLEASILGGRLYLLRSRKPSAWYPGRTGSRVALSIALE